MKDLFSRTRSRGSSISNTSETIVDEESELSKEPVPIKIAIANQIIPEKVCFVGFFSLIIL